jgi:hypothetical protein
MDAFSAIDSPPFVLASEQAFQPRTGVWNEFLSEGHWVHTPALSKGKSGKAGNF